MNRYGRFPLSFPSFGLLLICCLLLLISTQAYTAPALANWAFPDRSYRLPLTVSANGVARSDKVVEIDIDFGQRLTALGAAGSFAESSLRVAEVNGSGVVINDSVPFQFDNGAADTPDGTLLLLLTGSTASGASRTFHVYFDVAGGGFSQPTLTDRVVWQSDQTHRGQSSYVIETKDSSNARHATYYYHKLGGGFASIRDRDGEDWISYYPDANSKYAGEFRGIPNLGDVFHPGYSSSSGTNQGSNSTVLEDGVLKLTIQSISKDGSWKAIWEIFPTYARLTVVDIPNGGDYWFLYEGTPGGNFEYTGGSPDYLVTSANDTIMATSTVEENWDPEPDWVYVADGTQNRALFFTHVSSDDEPASFRLGYNATQTPPAGTTDNGRMTVLGFGRRTDTGVTRYLTAEGAQFTLGLIEDKSFSGASAAINSAYRPVTITMGNDTPQVSANTGIDVLEGETAVLTPTDLLVEDPEGGVITYTVTAVPAHGALRRSGVALTAGMTFTQAQLNGGAISYTHDGSDAASDSFTVTAADDVQSTGTITVAISITAMADYWLYLPVAIRP